MDNDHDKPLLSVKNLSKHFRSNWAYRPIQAVKDVSFDVYEGDAVGFIGHNGAGKTTTIKCIFSLLKANAGEILFNGKPICKKTRAELGYLTEQPYFYEHLTVEETLNFFASLLKLSGSVKEKRIDRVLDLLALRGVKKPVSYTHLTLPTICSV